MPSHERYPQQVAYSLKKEMNELYAAMAIKNFAVSLIGVFTPIYLYLFFRSLSAVAVFYGIQHVLYIIIVPFVAKQVQTLGVKKMMAVGLPFLGVYFFFLTQIEKGYWYLGAALFAKVVYLAFFWIPRHLDFAKFSQEKKEGRQLGTLNIVIVIAKTIAPFVAGWIIAAFGFPALFWVAAFCVVFSAVPLFFSQEVYDEYSFSYRTTFANIFSRRQVRIFTAFFGEGIEYFVNIFIFPIFVFAVIGSVQSIGLITTLSLFFALVVSYGVGYMSDRKGDIALLRPAAWLYAASWAALSFIKGTASYFFFSSLWRAGETAVHVPFLNLFYRNSKELQAHPVEYIVFREVAHHAGRVAASAIVLFFVAAVLVPFVYAALFGMAAFISLGYSYLVHSHYRIRFLSQ